MLFITDRKQGSLHIVAGAARQKFGNQDFDDFPLRVACVLRFIDEHVVDTEIELVKDPGRGRALGRSVAEQFECLVDQVLIVEQTAALFSAR